MKLSLPTVLLNNNILFPNNEIKLEFDNELSKNIISESEFFHDNNVLISYNLNKLEQAPKLRDLSNVGVLAKIIHKIDLPNGKTRVIIKGIKRVFIHEYLNLDRENEILESIVSSVAKQDIPATEEAILTKKLYKELEDCVHTVPYISNSFLTEINDIDNLDDMTDLIVPNLPLSYERLLEYLKEFNSVHRCQMILEDIYTEKQKFNIEKDIDLKIQQGIENNQKQYLLREKIKMLKEELGDVQLVNNDLEKLSNSVNELHAPEHVIDRLREELYRYENMANSFEASVVRNYIDYLLKLPWNNKTQDNEDLNEVISTLNQKHYGIEEVKNRIIEYLAVKKMSNNVNSPIICLVGPPGVGKTTLAYNIAFSIGRKFAKISVGGVNDPAELIGHRRTYIGAAPGRIIQELKKCQSSNPLFLIDEIDKMGKDIKGDPANVLLEVLDKTQNKHFSDNYVEEEFDLSNVMFIVTANDVDRIPAVLRDRLEIIYIDRYTEQEKLEICKRHIIPNVCLEYELNKDYIEFSGDALKEIIKFYTKEQGVRELERQIDKIIRKIVKTIVVNQIKVSNIKITVDNIPKYLGPRLTKCSILNKPSIGKVYSLGYTLSGGDLFPVEVTYYKGQGNLILTGNAGLELKESALVALDYVKANASKFGIKIADLLENDIHINLPHYEITKDGPSIGVALVTGIISAFKKKIIPNDISMTGEISLLGEVLPIGNTLSKIEIAHYNNLKTIFIPKDNSIDLNKASKDLLNGIEIIKVEDYSEIYERIFL